MFVKVITQPMLPEINVYSKRQFALTGVTFAPVRVFSGATFAPEQVNFGSLS